MATNPNRSSRITRSPRSTPRNAGAPTTTGRTVVPTRRALPPTVSVGVAAAKGGRTKLSGTRSWLMLAPGPMYSAQSSMPRFGPDNSRVSPGITRGTILIMFISVLCSSLATTDLVSNISAAPTLPCNTACHSHGRHVRILFGTPWPCSQHSASDCMASPCPAPAAMERYRTANWSISAMERRASPRDTISPPRGLTSIAPAMWFLYWTPAR
mmetsp:Transcript_11162/g.29397  ORF Transcript_11162/g.29397 Transcript_11162/m.29397 type:complete len:212 (+) Transcript_11162:159-794(+)